MKRFFTLVFMTMLILSSLGACAFSSADHSPETLIPTETIATIPPATEPPATTEPTEPPEPTLPPFVAEPGSYFNTYRNEEYDDYLDYYVQVPEKAMDGMPLVVYLHGDGEVNQPESLPKRGLGKLTRKVYGEEFPFILLEPNTRIKSWTSGNIPKLLIELITLVANEYNINMNKIIITGHSRGAIGVWDMISIYGDYFSAAVPVSSPHQKGHIDYLKAAEVPVWTFAGDIGDTECWYHQFLEKNVEMINVSGGFGKFTVLKGCDHGKAKNEAYVLETFEWMLAQERGVIPEAEE